MPKNEVLSPKAIANRIKAKGLPKVRLYCEMCQKQCRDENGFKCHKMTEGHLRQMEVLGQNLDRFIADFTEKFKTNFLDHMKRSHRFSRVSAKVVYDEYIAADRHHVHMKSTQWATLTEFVKYLGKTGKCKVEETPKGWFITYIDRDSDTLFRKNKRVRADLVDEEKMERDIKKQIQRAEQMMMKSEAGKPSNPEAKPLEKSEKIVLSLASSKSSKLISKDRLASSSLVFEQPEFEIKEQDKAKEPIYRKDCWLCTGIVVKILAHKGYYKQKGVVTKLIDDYVGEIEMIQSKHVLRVDQEELETVIPQIGCRVRILNGAYRGSNARLIGIDTEKFSARVQIEEGIYNGMVINDVEYEDICKVAA